MLDEIFGERVVRLGTDGDLVDLVGLGSSDRRRRSGTRGLLMVTCSTCGSSGLRVDLRHEVAEGDRARLGAVGLKELPDRQEHQDQQDPEQQSLVRLLHENLIVRERLRVSSDIEHATVSESRRLHLIGP